MSFKSFKHTKLQLSHICLCFCKHRDFSVHYHAGYPLMKKLSSLNVAISAAIEKHSNVISAIAKANTGCDFEHLALLCTKR